MAAATLAALRRLWAPAAGAAPLRRGPTALPLPAVAAVSTAAAEPPALSKRKQFRQVPVPPALLARIQAEGTCRRRLSPAERAARRRPRKPQADDEAGRDPTAREFARGFRFVGAAAVASSFPATDLPEVAFAGRSNVGKSSLLNALCATTQVRVSATPGLTRTLNFFRVGGWLQLVDMPGYGFAFVSDEERLQWRELIQTYLTQRAPLRRLFLLLDSRHGIKVNDRAFMEELDRMPVKYQVVFTKCDLVDATELARRVVITEEELAKRPRAMPNVVLVSSSYGAGIDKLRRIILNVAGRRVDEAPPPATEATAPASAARRRAL